MEDLISDMTKLSNIMITFGLNIRDMGDPSSKTIFCAIIGEKYPLLLDKIEQKGKLPLGYRSPKRIVSDYLCYKSINSVNYALSNDKVETLVGYKDYYDKYLIVENLFHDEELLIEYTNLIEKKLEIESEIIELINK